MPEVLRRVGRYDLLEVIGRGGAAVVYLAQQRDLRRPVALKELAPFHADDASFAERFVEESRLAGSMSHANVVTVHEFFEDGGVPYIAMEYLPHGSLRQYIGNLSTAQVAGVLEGVLAGLSHGEMSGIVHRDLKPENLLVAADGRVKIADFGVARAYNKAATRPVVTMAGTTIGTPAYMSPEQALGTELTPATDLYSLGVVAWEMLSGQVPFEEVDTPVAVLYRHVHEPIPSVRTVAPDVDERLAQWLEGMLGKRPQDRFQSAEAAWIDLEDVVLELLGPRWRREARLALGAPVARERTLTPAEFDSVAAEAAQAPEPPDPGPSPLEAAAAAAPQAAVEGPESSPAPHAAPATETVSGPLEKTPASNTTVAPKKAPRRNRTTMLRIARRHGETRPDLEPEAPARSSRNRMIAIAIIAAMTIAAAAGAVIAGTGGSKPPGRSAAAQRAAKATKAADGKLAKIMQELAVTRNQALARLSNATTQRAQARDVPAVQSAYSTAAKRVAAYTSATSAAAPLHTTLEKIAADYGRLAAAGRAGNQRRWKSASTAVSTAENQLKRELAKL